MPASLAGPVLVLCAAAAFGACRGEGAPDSRNDAASTAPARADGRVLRGDVWVPVVPTVLHDAKMDLATRCKLMRDEAKGQGREVPLCYLPERKPGRAVTHIVVERDVTMARVMQRLTAANEGAHFVVDKTGGIYQVLDLGFVARHGDAYPEGEIRVIACQAEGEAALVAALKALYPGAGVTTKDMTKGAEP